MSAPQLEQSKQIHYWLRFLKSSLPPSSPSNKSPAFKVVAVGLRKDLDTSKSPLTIPSIYNLPLINSPLHVSSHKTDGIKELLKVLQTEAEAITKQHASNIPVDYHNLILSFRNLPEDQAILTREEILNNHAKGMDEEKLRVALRFLHAVGAIIILKDNLVCVSPLVVPNYAAKFNSENVRVQLGTDKELYYLDELQIATVLHMIPGSDKLSALSLIVYFWCLLTFVVFQFTRSPEVVAANMGLLQVIDAIWEKAFISFSQLGDEISELQFFCE